MSGVITACTAAAVTTVATVVVAALPEAQAIISPLTEGANEYSVISISVLASVPMLAAMTLLAISGRE